jgi:hypothetical protein
MARLPAAFDARTVPPIAVGEATIPLTFGSGRDHGRWTDQRSFSWPELAALLAQVEVGPKDGPCYTQGIFSGVRRFKHEATRIHVVVLDSDTGQPMEEIAERIRQRGWRAILHTTHSHQTTRTQLAAEPYDRWLASRPASSSAMEPEYMAGMGYAPAVVANANIVDELTLPNGRGGTVRYYLFEHSPMPKFRVVLHLDVPWLAADYQGPEVATAVWKGRVEAVAHALGLSHDQSCVDTSRLFYLPRVRSQQSEFLHQVIEGEACPIWNLPDAPHVAAAGVPGAPRPRTTETVTTGPEAGDFNLTAWAARYALRFEVVDAMRARCPDMIGTRRSGVKQHIECPNVENHLTDQTTRHGTYAVNASQMSRAELPGIQSGFTIHCLHAGCAGTDRLQHIAALIRRRKLAVEDLTDEAFLIPAAPLVDVSNLIRSAQQKRQAEESAAPEVEGPVGADDGPPRDGLDPAFAERLPGVLGAMVNWILATSPKPQPVLALGASLVMMAGAIGRKVRVGTVRPNLYIVGLAKSGAGKNRPLVAVKQVAAAAGVFDRLVGVEEIASDAGIVASVTALPSQAMLIDEIGFLLSAVSNLKNGAHVQNITGTLMKLYSSSDTVYKGKSYADAKNNKVIDQPCASLYGTTVPRGFFSNLTTTELTGGLLSRVMLFDTGQKRPQGRAPEELPPPQGVKEWLRAWDARPLLPSSLKLEGGKPVLDPLNVPMSPEAAAIMEQCRQDMEVETERADARGTDALYVRVHENALKLALIRACAVDPVRGEGGRLEVDTSSMMIDAETARWACALSLATTRVMEAGAVNQMADSDYERQQKRVLAFIRGRQDRGATNRDIGRDPCGRMPPKRREELMQSLIENGEVFYVNTREGRPGRPRHAYIHRDFINPDFLRTQDDPDDDEAAAA